MTLVTVIIPAFNAEDTLERTVLSALSQTHKELEVLVIDDGSTDGTIAVAERVAQKDRRMRVLQKDNGGVAAARNLGLRHAKGDYVAWLDADDLWHPTKIEKQLAVFATAAEPPSMVYTGYRLIDGDDRVLRNFRPLTDVSGHTLCRQIATNFFSNVSSIMVPTDLARRLGGHDPILRAIGMEGAEDLLFQLRLSMVGALGCVKEALVGYRMHSGNMSLDHKRATRSNLKALEMIEQQAPEISKWVFKLGRARVAGYAAYMLARGEFVHAFGVLRYFLRGQPAYTVLTFLLILRHAAKSRLGIFQIRDPAMGARFFDADPASVPWQDHMVLTRWHRKKLDREDARIAFVSLGRSGSPALEPPFRNSRAVERVVVDVLRAP